jgi:hypothetical protein
VIIRCAWLGDAQPSVDMVASLKRDMRVSLKLLVDTMIWETLAADRRRALRRPIGRLGTIRTEPGATPHTCLVIDESDDGGVRVTHHMILTYRMNLYCASQAKRPATKWFGATVAR